MPRTRTSKTTRTPRAPKQKAVDHYAHEGKKRKNNPPVGLVSSATDKLDGRTKYQHDPHIDPFLSWAGKAEGMSFEVPNVSLHVHERIDPQRIVKSFLKEDTESRQISLFEQPDNKPPLNRAIDFYSHEQDWTNRLIAGDSLLVMNSLLQKEGMAGKVQMVYIDPPYGIKYNSNFQPFVNKRDVKDGNDADLSAEPEQIRAFRDTWELGIHSYLTHLRERLRLARELLNESGSCFVQISDENLHHVRELMDEVFGAANFAGLIAFQKTGSSSDDLLGEVYDYIVWYAKDVGKAKFRRLYLRRSDDTGMDRYDQTDPDTGPYRLVSLLSDGMRTGSSGSPFEFEGEEFKPKPGTHWSVTLDGMRKLAWSRRVVCTGTTLQFKKLESDFTHVPLTNNWRRVMIGKEKIFVVQTAASVVARCLLMTTDPGDLALDPTCGSGTTAYVAEQWGRRWITCDTSRVAITLARQRLMTATFDYFELAHPSEGLGSGFKYKTVPHVTIKSIANNPEIKEGMTREQVDRAISKYTESETLYDQPVIDKTKRRVTGPFTVEAVPSLRTRPFNEVNRKRSGNGSDAARFGETSRQAQWRDELKATGIRATGNKFLTFARIEPATATKFLHAEGEIQENGTTRRSLVSFGPDYGALEQRQVEEAIKEARTLKPKPDLVIFAAFHFDPEAAKDIDQIDWPGVTILKAQMSVDLLTGDLRKKRSSNQSYWLIGQPDVDAYKLKDGTYQVKVNGFDYYNPVTGEIESGGTSRIAMWFLDTDYDERSLLPEQVFFPMKDAKRDWTRLAKALNGSVDEERLEAFVGTESLPFKAGEHKHVAVKIIDDRGIESFVIKKLP